jgi:acetyl esterase/lipase
MPSDYDLAPEFAKQPSFTLPANRWLLRAVDGLVRLQRRGFRWRDAVDVQTHLVHVDAAAVVPVLEIAPRDLTGTAPALVDYHGGGFFLSHAALHLRAAERYALEGRCRVFFPDYRLSTQAPFPAAFDDCYAALAFVHARAGELGVDPRRVALVGDSAGGALAAGVAQQALDRGEHPVCAQVLIYPVTDHETRTDSALRFTDTPLWRTGSNRNMWKVYLRGSAWARGDGTAPPPAYAAPLHRERFAGLPPARVELAEFDPLRDEGRRYAEALEKAGVPVELRLVRRAIHGYDLVEGSATAEAVFAERMESIRRFLGTQAA